MLWGAHAQLKSGLIHDAAPSGIWSAQQSPVSAGSVASANAIRWLNGHFGAGDALSRRASRFAACRLVTGPASSTSMSRVFSRSKCRDKLFGLAAEGWPSG
jgi:hypothetical protein